MSATVAVPPRTTPPPNTTRDRAVLVGLVVAVTAFGSAAAAVGFALTPAAPSATDYPSWWPPLPLFWSVWLVIYPCSAVAAWLVWRRRDRHDVRGALTAFAVMNVSSALFLPVSNLVGELPSVMTLMDLNGVVTVSAIAWLFSRYSRRAALWMLPYLVWMPVTTLLKIALWRYNA